MSSGLKQILPVCAVLVFGLFLLNSRLFCSNYWRKVGLFILRDGVKSSVFENGLNLHLQVSEEDYIGHIQNQSSAFAYYEALEDGMELAENVTKRCHLNSHVPTSLSDLTTKQMEVLLKHILVNDEYKFIYCYVPKVACSNWKRTLLLLDEKIKSHDETSRLDHHHGFKYLSDYSREEIEKKLATYFKFVYVRNPYERLLSGYRNKFNEIESYYRKYGKEIADLFHKGNKEEYRGKIPGDDVTISDLLKYLTSGVKNLEFLDEHFTPMHFLCQPCVINYDFVGTYDKIGPGSEAVLQKVGAPPHIHFPQPQRWYKPTTANYLRYYYSLVDRNVLTKFHNVFSLDFNLFSFADITAS